MVDEAVEEGQIRAEPVKKAGLGWQVLWLLLHLAAVYAVVEFCTAWLAGWTKGQLMPLLGIRTSSSRPEFLFSHLFTFSFIPAFLAALTTARFRHKVAQFAWLIPAVVLAYKLATFPNTGSVFYQGHSFPALHQYFGGDFLIPDYRNWREFWAMTAFSSDMERGMAQLKFTAPFYAGIGYSLAMWLCLRTDLDKRIVQAVTGLWSSRLPSRQ
jgi:hypothetical protein